MPTLAATELLDRMSPKRPDTVWVDAQRNDERARFLVLCDLKPVVTLEARGASGDIKWFGRDQLTALRLPEENALFLGVTRDEGVPHFAIALSEHQVASIDGAAEVLRPAIDLRSLAMRGELSPEEQSLAGQARSLAQWHENCQCCGKCGAPTRMMDAGWRRKCGGCGLDWFPRTDPVVIMLVTDGERCILAHEHRYAPGMYSTLAGFLEPGEDIEHAVRREVLEETGILVGKVEYYRSQPWPFPHSLMLGCIAYADTTELQVDLTELADARWFSRAEALSMIEGTHPERLTAPGKHAIAHVLLKAFVDGKTG